MDQHRKEHSNETGPVPRLIIFWGVWPNCTIQTPTDFRVFQEGWESVMGLDTGKVFKRSVFCPHCKEDYLFTLRAIADNPELKCHGCHGSIRVSDRAYEALLSDVKDTLHGIDSALFLYSPGRGGIT
jgi:hypothetical protein